MTTARLQFLLQSLRGRRRRQDRQRDRTPLAPQDPRPPAMASEGGVSAAPAGTCMLAVLPLVADPNGRPGGAVIAWSRGTRGKLVPCNL